MHETKHGVRQVVGAFFESTHNLYATITINSVMMCISLGGCLPPLTSWFTIDKSIIGIERDHQIGGPLPFHHGTCANSRKTDRI